MSKYELAVRRAALPEVLLPPDVAAALDIPEELAEPGVRQGRFGPAFLVNGRPAVLRETFLRHLSEQASIPAAREVSQ